VLQGQQIGHHLDSLETHLAITSDSLETHLAITSTEPHTYNNLYTDTHTVLRTYAADNKDRQLTFTQPLEDTSQLIHHIC
jgi:hypothetical protein